MCVTNFVCNNFYFIIIRVIHIVINTNNYNERLQQIRDLTNSDITFLETFSQKNSPYFQQQITADLGDFHHGSALLSQAIAVLIDMSTTKTRESDVYKSFRIAT